ncbi:hypothetical protein HKX48_001651 [Thoreauomyces humboldtii]|nr:hypothetical protein HKX48_001651 [Thoreauomyces humboldtii]
MHELVHGCQAHAHGSDGFGLLGPTGAEHIFNPALQTPKYAPSTTIQSVHIDIDMDLREMEQHRARAQIQHTFVGPKVVGRSLLSSIKLDGVGFLDMEVQGEGVSWTYDGLHVTIAWATPFAAEEKRTVTLKYTVQNPIIGLFFEVPTKEYPDRVLHCITDNESERCRYWLACVDFPVVRTTLSFSLRAAADMHALANGSHVGEKDHGDGSKTTQWKLDIPCPSYLVVFAVGHFEEVVDREVNGIPVKYYAPKGTPHDDMMRLFGKTTSMMEWLPKKLDMAFPWPKYFQIASPKIAGAMEDISLVTWTSVYLMDANFAQDYQRRGEMTNLHEMAHTYFGDLLVIRHFEHVWLKESWATFMEACWLEDHHSKDEHESELLRCMETYVGECAQYMRPMCCRTYEDSWSMFDQHTYPGGSARLNMLRKLLGDDAFWSGVQDYLKTFRTQVVETDEFRRCLEKASGLNLVKFFDQWFYSKGYPALKASYDYSPERKQVSITFEQTQVDKKKDIGIFDCIIPVEITDADKNVHRGEAEFNSDNGSTKATVVIPLGSAKPTIVRVDPNITLLRTLEFDPGEDILGNTAKDGGDLLSRVWAYRTLVKNGGVSAFKKVEEAIVTEPYWDVRRRVAEALGKANSLGALRILLSMLKSEKNTSVQWKIVSQLTLRNEEAREALLEFLHRKEELPYLAHAAALRSLGQQRNPADLSYLLSVAQDDTKIGHAAFVRTGALDALAATRTPEAFEYLLTRLEPGKERNERSRPGVAAAIASIAGWQPAPGPKRAVETIAHHLHDPNSNVRKACVAALTGALEARGSVADIMATRPLWDAANWSGVKASVQRLKSAGDGKTVDQLLKAVEVMEEKLRKMEEKEAVRDAREKAQEKSAADEKK